MATSTGISIDAITNVTNATLKAYEKSGKWLSIFPDLTNYVGWMLKNSKKFSKPCQGGMPYQWNVQVAGLSTTQHVGAYSKIALSDNEISKTAEVSPRHTLAHFSMDLFEKRAQAGGKMLVDLVEQKYNAMMESHVKTMEPAIWGCPHEDDEKTFLGFATWVVMWATGATTPENGGFIGTLPYGGGAVWTTAPNGLSTTAYTRANNWAAKYTVMSYADAIDKMAAAADKTNFQAPSAFAQLIADMPEEKFTRAVYMGYDEYRDYTNLVRQQDGDNKSGDADYYNGKAQFRGRPVQYVPHLDSVTGDPIYMLHHDSVPFLHDPEVDGKVIRELTPNSAEQPTTMTKVYGWTHGTVGIARHMNAVLSKTSKEGASS